MAECSNGGTSPILHVVVVGFHHKKGCQLEYSYPPVIPGQPVNSHELPSCWKHLPSLALPDGAHNFTKDTTYFHLTSCDGSSKTIYGISCYRQIDSKDLVNKTDDITRSTVQKSVCVLSKLPLYGRLKTKLELITHAYFDEKDFSKVELLEQTYNNLQATVTDSQLIGSQLFLDLSARDVVMLFKHKIVMMFKLILLERRVLFSGSPVDTLSKVLLAVISLFPGMIEFGLEESASYSLQKQLSPTLHSTNLDSDMDEFMELRYKDEPHPAHRESSIGIEEGEEALPHGRLVHTYSQEPESPTILRDSDPLGDTETTANKDVHSKSPFSSKVVKNVENERVRSRSSSSIEEASKSISNEQSASASTEFVCQNYDTPLAHLQSITHIEAVQSSSSSSIETYGHCQEQASAQDDVTQESIADKAKDKLRKAVSIEELDSPESLSQIDKEDCFSWEEDKLLLEIDHDVDTKTASDISDAQTDSGETEVNGAICPSKEIKDVSNLSVHLPSRENVIIDKNNKSHPTESINSKKQNTASPAKVIKKKISTALSNVGNKEKSQKAESNTSDLMEDDFIRKASTNLHQDENGMPLAIFSKGSLCHPYLSLQLYDLLQDVNVRSFVVGATNILFKQKRHLTDVVIEVSDGKIDMHDNELRKVLTLSTADLRFADVLVKSVFEDNNAYLDGTEWEGGDEWIREQFRIYLVSLLKSTTIATNSEKYLDDYNMNFIQAWKTTHNYRVWHSTLHPGMENVPIGHPFQGNLNVGDLKVRLSHTMQSTERGKKINAAVNQTGKYVVQTGKAVGGALNHAKSAVSSWFSSWKQDKDEPAT